MDGGKIVEDCATTKFFGESHLGTAGSREFLSKILAH